MNRDESTVASEARVMRPIGGRLYYAWIIFLTLVALIGGHAYCRQVIAGLSGTGLSDQVSWGVYNANLTFLVGLAVSAVLLVIPAYIYRNKDMYDVVLLGGLLSIAAIVMCFLFIMVDIGRLDRLWHVVPFLGTPNLPSSMLALDICLLGGYLILNIYVCGFALYKRYIGQHPTFLLYGPHVAISIGWALIIHIVTVFLYAGLVGRPFWNAAVVAPRFLGSAFTAGPGILIISFYFIGRFWRYKIGDHAIDVLRYIVTASLLLNVFLLASETFKVLYAAPTYSNSARYLFFGLEHNGQFYNGLVPWIWVAIGMQIIASLILITPQETRRPILLNVACAFAIVGIWIEKGMGMVVAGFIPSPQGIVVEYAPTLSETAISFGIWAFGLLFFSWMLHLAIPILNGSVRAEVKGDNPSEIRQSAAAT